MNDFITPKNHENFKALPLASNIDEEISDCAIAFIEPGGGGPSPDHRHCHDHLFTVISGEIEVRMGADKRQIKAGMSIRVNGEIPHSVWNRGSSRAKVIGISLNKQDRDPYHKKYESILKLKNGKEVFLRPIMDSDRHHILDLFNRMSRQSIYLRFLRRLSDLPENLLDKLINIDYHSNFALVAIARENAKDTIVAVGRYGKDPDEGDTELAVAVRDDWQHAGLGKYMLSKVVDIAKEQGISHFTGIMDPHNNVIQNLLLKLGYKVKYSMESGFYQVKITA